MKKADALKMIQKTSCSNYNPDYLLEWNSITESWMFIPVKPLNELPKSNWYRMFWDRMTPEDKYKYLGSRKCFHLV